MQLQRRRASSQCLNDSRVDKIVDKRTSARFGAHSAKHSKGGRRLCLEQHSLEFRTKRDQFETKQYERQVCAFDNEDHQKRNVREYLHVEAAAGGQTLRHRHALTQSLHGSDLDNTDNALSLSRSEACLRVGICFERAETTVRTRNPYR